MKIKDQKGLEIVQKTNHFAVFDFFFKDNLCRKNEDFDEIFNQGLAG